MGPVTVQGSDFTRRLIAVLSDAKYSAPPGKYDLFVPPRFIPEVAYRLRSGHKSVTVAICFESSAMDVTCTDDAGRILSRRLVPFETKQRELLALTNQPLPRPVAAR